MNKSQHPYLHPFFRANPVPQLQRLVKQQPRLRSTGLIPLILLLLSLKSASFSSPMAAATADSVCGDLDDETRVLAVVVDAVAALSCEALRADTRAFSLTDSGDGSADKNAVGVASDMKILLNGSKMVGKVSCPVVSGIPKLHGMFRGMQKSWHSSAQGWESEEGGAVGVVLNALASLLLRLGMASLRRARLDLDAAVMSESLKNQLLVEFESKCPAEDVLLNSCNSVFDSYLKDDFGKFVLEVNALLGIVWRVVAWEGTIAFVALESGEIVSGKGFEEPNGGGDADVVKIDEKKKKKDKKKVVLGKGTTVTVQFINDRLQRTQGDSGDSVEGLKNWVELLTSFFDPKKPELNELVATVKEIVQSNESTRLPKLPKGTRDFAKEQMAVREKVMSKLTEIFKRHGATALDTPVFELKEILTGKYGEDSKLIYDLADQGGELCSLRYDLTVPFARYMAMNNLTSFKRYQIAKVYRRDNPAKGRYREFYQCDFDIAGQSVEMGPDYEIVKILTECLNELEIGDYEVKLNHRKLLDGLLEICGVPPEKFRTICSSIDKLDKLSFDQVKKEMVEVKGLDVEMAERIGTFTKLSGPPKALLLKLKEHFSQLLANASSKSALDELGTLFEALEESNCIDKVVFDLSLARGLDYYTGVIFEAVPKGTVQVGSIAAGGRYDNLIGMFGKMKVPAVGVSIGIERVFAIMEERKESTRPTETEVQLSIIGDARKLPVAAKLAGELWDAKLKAEYLISTRITKHLDNAKNQQIPWMVIVGDKELENGIVKLKKVGTKEEEEVPRINFVQELKRRLQK